MNNRIAFVSMICLCFVSAACAPQVDSIREAEVSDIVWQALEPNTSSHNRAAWEIVEARIVTGETIQDQFEGGTGCAPGPQPPDNATIGSDVSYWYVQFKPRPATPLPEPTEQYSPTAPPRKPEPFVYQADFLVDAATGEIVARKIYCVIY
jgi:hypothetical protein